MNRNSALTASSLSELTLVNGEVPDKSVSHLLEMLDRGTETTMNLQTLLENKTDELTRLVQQLEIINQALEQVEYGTEQIELVLKDSKMDNLVYAETTLDSALESACSLCGIPNKNKAVDYNESIKPPLIKKLNVKLKQLKIDPSYYFYKSDDVDILQKSVIDLEIAKTMSTLIKADYKRRNALMKSKNTNQEIKQLEDKIREQLKLWSNYTRNAPFMIQNKDITTLLDRKSYKALCSRYTPSSMAKLSMTPGSVLKFRQLLSKKGSSWFTAAKAMV